jgi:hypothetical protein
MPKLKIADPKTIDDLKKNLENLAEQVIGKDITKGVINVSNTNALTTTETASSGGIDDDMLNHLKADVTSLKSSIDSIIIQVNLLISNVKGQ